MRIAFDIGGVLSKYPDQFRELIGQLVAGGTEVFVITDMHDRQAVLDTLLMNGFAMFPSANVRCADYAAHGEGCKAELLRELAIDIFVDDFIGYVALPGCPIRLLVMPDATRPYWAESWKTSTAEAEFGRRVYQAGIASAAERELMQLRGDLAAERAQTAQLKERIAALASTAGGHIP